MQATFFTPSYIGDLDRAVWMCRSLRQYFQGTARHILAVPRQQRPQFRKAFGHDPLVEIVSQETVVPRAFYPDLLYRLAGRIAKHQIWRLEGRGGRPGWIIQQIVKLGCSRWIDSGAAIFIDSDLIFTRPFDLADLGLAEGTRPLVRITPRDEHSRHRAHIDNARKLLGLPPGASEHHYMAYPTIWHVEWLRELQRHLACETGRTWQMALHRAGHISEYSIYGIFVEEILKPRDLNLITRPFHRIAWDAASFEDLKHATLEGGDQPDDALSLVIQSNLNIPPAQYEDMLRRILNS